MTITLTVLGSGTAVPSLERSACAIMVETGKATLVFDTGPGTMRRLLEAGRHLNDVSHIFYSHFHPDHTSELVPFLFAVKYHPPLHRPQGITLTGGPGFIDYYGRLQHAHGDWMAPEPGFVDLVEMVPGETGRTEYPGFTVDTGPVQHKPESLAYRITAPCGTSIVYSGDTDFSEDLIQLATGADLFVCESAFPDDLKTDKHATPSIAGRMAEKAGVDILMLTHFYPACDKVDLAKQCRRTYSGRLILAEDLLKITL